MELIEVEFPTLGRSLPMLKTDEHGLMCTSHILCSAVGIDQNHLRTVMKRHRERLPVVKFGEIGGTNCPPIEVLKENRGQLGLKYIRENMILWPLRTMLKVAFLVHTPQAFVFHDEGIRLLENTIKERSIDTARYNTLAAEHEHLKSDHQDLRQRLLALEAIVFPALPAIDAAASAAGAALNAQKGSKRLRDLN